MTPLDTPIWFLATANAERSRAFYERVLGLAFVSDEAAGVVVPVAQEIYPNGRFARLRDPEGNPIQLWEAQ